MTDPTCDCCWRTVKVDEYTSNCFCGDHAHGSRRHIDHAARAREIEARLEAATPGPWRAVNHQTHLGEANIDRAWWAIEDAGGRVLANMVSGPNFQPSKDGPLAASAPADLRYLLDRVRELEAAVFISWRVYDRFGHWQCGHCGMDEMEDRHAPSCIVLTLPAPETVETQG